MNSLAYIYERIRAWLNAPSQQRPTPVVLTGINSDLILDGTIRADKIVVEPIVPTTRHPLVSPVVAASALQPWMPIAWSYFGQKEIKGKLHNTLIVELFALAGFSGIKDDETAWCAAYTGGTLARAGLKGSGSLAARSYEKYGTKLAEPIYGCIGVKKRADPNAPSWQGHLGYVVGANSQYIYLLGGNQNDQVSVAAYPRKEFTAFIYPAGVDVPKNPPPLPKDRAGATKAATEA